MKQPTCERFSILCCVVNEKVRMQSEISISKHELRIQYCTRGFSTGTVHHQSSDVYNWWIIGVSYKRMHPRRKYVKGCLKPSSSLYFRSKASKFEDRLLNCEECQTYMQLNFISKSIRFMFRASDAIPFVSATVSLCAIRVSVSPQNKFF